MSKHFDLDPKIENAEIGTKKLSSISNQMIKGVHPDFLICAKAMCSVFSSIEKNQALHLMPSLVPDLELCLHMIHRELNLQCIELEYEKS